MFLLNYTVTALTFHLAPDMPLADTYPDILAGTPEHKISLIYMKVVGTLSLAAALTTCPPPIGTAMSLGAIAAQMAYDVPVRPCLRVQLGRPAGLGGGGAEEGLRPPAVTSGRRRHRLAPASTPARRGCSMASIKAATARQIKK